MHGADVGEAYRLAALSPDARGAYNIAADPVLDRDELARVLRSRAVTVPTRLVRALADLTYRARLQPAPPGWLDMGLAVPTMSTRRAREELGWTPRHSADDALLELLAGMARAGGCADAAAGAARGRPLPARERCARASAPGSDPGSAIA